MEVANISRVQDFRAYLNSKRRVEFTLNDMAEYLSGMPFQKPTKSKDEYIHLIKQELADCSKPLAHVVPIKNSKEEIKPSKTKIVMLEDYIRIKGSKRSVLNCAKSEKYFSGQLPVFYNREYHKHEVLTTPLILMEKIVNSLDRDLRMQVRQVGNPPLLKDVLLCVAPSERFIQLIHLLPFIDPKQIITDKAAGQQFFTELYNVMRLHILMSQNANNLNKSRIAITEDATIYQNYHYNVAGVNLCLNDIRYGILGCTEKTQSGNKITKVSWICFKAPTKQIYSQFNTYDYRNRLVCGPRSGRVAIALHEGIYYQSLTTTIMGENCQPSECNSSLNRLKPAPQERPVGRYSVDDIRTTDGNHRILETKRHNSGNT